MVGALMLSMSSVFGQKVQDVPHFSSDAEKQAWINAHPSEYERISGEKVTVPVFKTPEEKAAWYEAKNPQAVDPTAVPKFKNDAEKKAWIEKQEAAKRTKEVVINAEDPTFPKMILTGNPELDAANYAAAKDAWYAAKEAAENKVDPAELKAKNESLRQRGIEVNNN